MFFYKEIDKKYIQELENYYNTVASFRTWDDALLFFNLSKFMKPNSKILIAGSGQGFEALCFKLFLPDSQIDLIDNWSEPFIHRNNKFYRNNHIDNTKDNFLKNCDLFNVDFNLIECNLFDIDASKIKITETYDLIYYNIIANTQEHHKNVIHNMFDFFWDILNKTGFLVGGGYHLNKPNYKMTPIVNKFSIDKDIEIHYNKLNWVLEK